MNISRFFSRTLLALTLSSTAVLAWSAPAPAGSATSSSAKPTAAPQQNGDYGFTLEGVDGKVSDQDFKGKYILLSFGYTSCPDICPTTLYEIDQTLRQLEHPEKLQAVFVSVDPTIDTPERVAQYAHGFNKNIVGLTADYDTLKKLIRRYGASFGYRFGNDEVVPPNLPSSHSVYHSTLIYLLSPKREIIDAFDYQAGHEELTKDINKILSDS
ncbi:SCO family protein [Brackiella oedipodis]|uniref:SCO family protein n=1 Tax=Brackiella oedipodis TaxID=124225 RepID=UPI0006851A56|nr:SCO family protein [Brackiella oedipodis]